MIAPGQMYMSRYGNDGVKGEQIRTVISVRPTTNFGRSGELYVEYLWIDQRMSSPQFGWMFIAVHDDQLTYYGWERVA